MTTKNNYSVFTAAWLLVLFPAGRLLAQSGKNTVSFTRTSDTAYEAGSRPVTLSIKRSDKKGPLTVLYTLETTAIAGKDFTAVPDQVRFKDGEAEKHITLRPLTDYSFNRKDKMLVFSLTPGKGYSTGDRAVARITIIQDGSPKPLPDDTLFFQKLNLALPGLIRVKAAIARGSYTAARKELAAYYRLRSQPVYPDRKRRPNIPVANEALQNTYSITGLKYCFGKGSLDSIDWSYSVEGNPNWSWEINRFSWWRDLSLAYLAYSSKNDVYAKRLFFELGDWLKRSPIDVTIKNQLQAGNRWRHLETGIRLESSWTSSFFLLKNSPLLSDELLVDWVKGFYQHGRFLESNAELATNRGFTEANGLFIAGSFFPEFKEAAGWQQLALTRMENILKTDVNEDGTLKELSPGYHHVTFGVIQGFMNFARANQIPLTPAISRAAEKLLNYYVFAQEPNGVYPLMNDSYRFKASSQLGFGHQLFPAREDFLYGATDRQQGKPPATTSHLFANGGQAVMRSGWKSDDNYLLMDAGPLGTSHGHEDKLSINVDGYGVRHIIDCGPYNYEDTNPFRIYSVSTHGKSAPLVDNLNQNRRLSRALNTRAAPVTWFSSDRYDYAAASYGADSLESWGRDRLRPAITTRHIFYLKPDVWVVIDAFRALDQQPHTYSSLFQCSDDTVDVDTAGKTVLIRLRPGEFDPFSRTTVQTVQPSLRITPLLTGGLSLSVVKGQETPEIAGWQFEKSTSWKKQAIPTAHYQVRTTGDAQLTYALAAAPAGKEAVPITLSPVPAGEQVYGVKLRAGHNTETILLVSLSGNSIQWKGTVYKNTALIIESVNGSENIIPAGNAL